MQHLRFTGLLVLLLGAAGAAEAFPVPTIYLKWHETLTPQQVNNEWQTGAADLDAVLGRFPLSRVEPLLRPNLKSDPVGLNRILRLDLTRSADLKPLLSELRRLPGVEYAEEPPIRYTDDLTGKYTGREPDFVPGDPYYPDQWVFPVMQAPAAWDLTKGDPSVVVAIVDNGTDWDHPDLDENIWSNSGEIANNGLDDDGNGFVDDVRGWDFQDDDNDPNPEIQPGYDNPDYHGTHTAGLVGAIMNNGRGVVGMAPECKVMAVRAGEGGTIYYGIQGILYAAHNGADVISLSWGGPGAYSLEQDIITDALIQGAVIIAAAGNNGTSQEHYPAAYDNVIAVASTDPDDGLSSFSNYGSWISVSAPGQVILSLVPDGYGTAYGTSMATPLVAGVAALVKSYHPFWTADQISAQILYTADDISAKNPLFSGMIGSGRVNAYRAVAETAPGMQIADLSFSEISGNSNGKVDPGEHVALVLSLQNYGSSTSDVVVTLSSDDPYIQVNQSQWNLPELTSGATANNSADPFEIYVQVGSPGNREVQLIFAVESETFYSTSLQAPIWISPTFTNHDTGSVAFTITDFGAFGYYNLARGESYGKGFRYPKQGSNALFHGSLMAGTSTEKVSDYAYGIDYYPGRFDWATVSGGELTIFPGTQADQEGLAVYQDTQPPLSEQVGLRVTQHSYAWSNPPYDDFVILSFSLQNVSGEQLSDLYVGLFMDWDIISLINLNDNDANWDQNLALGYAFNSDPLAPNPRYYGTSLLSGDLASYRVIDTSAVASLLSITDAQKYEFMSSGFVQTATTTSTDLATLLAAGPYALANGQSEQVAFAVLGGENLVDLQANALAALDAWNSLQPTSATIGTTKPARFTINEVFPRPANAELRLKFTLPGPGEVFFDLIDPLGRSLPIHQQIYSEGGFYTVSIPRWNGASGVYFLRGTCPYGSSAARIVWIK